MSGTRPSRVLVIGSGLAGLTTAYLLRQEGFEVYVVEKSNRLGFHSASVDIPPLNGKDKVFVVDVPMRSFQGGYYPLLIALYKHLGIPLQSTSYTFSFSRQVSQPGTTRGTSPSSSNTYFIYSGASGLSLPSLPHSSWSDPIKLSSAVLNWIINAVCYIFLVLIAFISHHSLISLPSDLHTVKDYCDAIPLGWIFNDFISDIIIPLFSAVGTMTDQDVLEAPLPILLDYIYKTLGTPHYTLGQGKSARDIAERLIAPVIKQGEGYLRLETEVESIEEGEEVVVRLKGGEEIRVDRVVIATQASVAASLLKSLTHPAYKAVARVQHRETTVATHTDRSVLPQSQDIRDINLYQPSGSQSYAKAVSGVYTMATHVIRHKGREILQTTNPSGLIDESRILGLSKLERALPGSHVIDLPRLLSRSRISVVGSYAYHGIPLLEGCIGSALRAVEEMILDQRQFGYAPRNERIGIGRVDWSAGKGSILGELWRMHL